MGVQEGDGVVTQPPNYGEKPSQSTDKVATNSTEVTTVGATDGPVKLSKPSQFQQIQVRVLTLNHDEHHDSTLFRLEKGWSLQLRPGPTMFGKTVSVFTNHPEKATEVFMRTKYRRLSWKSDTLTKGDDTALYAEINILVAGSFHYYFTYDDIEDRERGQGSGYFIVNPTLRVGPDNDILPLDCVQCQTVLSKCLGPYPQWWDRLRVGKESGYNMIHFTPVQELGISGSCYSLADQHKLNSSFSTPSHPTSMNHIQGLVKQMKDEWKVLSLTDIVLNHSANESPWLKRHPESAYSVANSPHLRPAYILDRMLYRLTVEVADNKWEQKGIPKHFNTEEHLQAITNLLYGDFMQEAKLHEFYSLNVEKIVQEFREKIEGHIPTGNDDQQTALSVIYDPQYRRNSSSVDMTLALRLYNRSWGEEADEDARINGCCSDLRNRLNELNHQEYEKMQGHLKKAAECCIGTIRYDRLQHDGPKLPEVSKNHPLVPPYFTHCGPDNKTLAEDEKLTVTDCAKYLMAHNGWVMGDDPLNDFAKVSSNVYLRRELVAWGDSVKLRYGTKPEDNEYLWDHMKRYVEEMARAFHGIRLDNCHSTPIHVAEYMLDAARRVRPDLYVIAELFTNSDLTDNIFVNRLGLNSLIREGMSAPNSHEQGRLVFRYGGEPVGAFLLPPVRPLVPTIAHAIFMDMTHDNPSPIETRTVWDLLPSAALVNMACCASGSTRGYDELVPHQIHVVAEKRLYQSWSSSITGIGHVNPHSAIIRCKKLLNDLHSEMGLNGYNQVFVDQVTEHVVTVTRHNPVTHQSIVMAAYTSFVPPANIQNDFIRPLKVQGSLDEIIFEFRVTGKNESDIHHKRPEKFTEDNQYINGLDSVIVEVKEGIQPNESALVNLVSDDDASAIELRYTSSFRPGSVIAFRLSLQPKAQMAINKIRNILSDFGYKQRISEVTTHNPELLEIVKSLTLCDLNYVLYRCAEEEQEDGMGGGIYHIPNFRSLPYCGLQGFISILSEIRVHNDLGHPMCSNLRDGNWMFDYTVGRLKRSTRTEKLGRWIEDVFLWLNDVPRYLIPAYFDSIITAIYLTLINHAWALMGGFIADGSDFAKALGLCSIQFNGIVKSALLPALSPALMAPQPPILIEKDDSKVQTSVSLCAGLPHFSVGYMRNWGRDTFIALPGNLLITGRFEEARWVILSFAGTLRHGLIPNLLDRGVNSRYNCRDAVWWWFFSIQQYITHAPNGHKILKDKVSRMYPTDDSDPLPPGEKEENLEDTMQEALQRHFQGLKFRERNAGYQIDCQMNDEGFNNEIGISLDTGFPYGGNPHNCGTWMDKMGSSEVSGTKGRPATPRDGSAVEIVGLCKATLHFLIPLYKDGKYPFNSVERTDDTGNMVKWTYEFWEKKISDNFEKHFWINDTPVPENEPKKELINRRGIYKDTHNSSTDWADLQLRPNFPIALAVAPEMVTPRNAWLALQHAEKILLGPLGIKTLDPSDLCYNGVYDNGNDSGDPKISNGYNYHQGPEWLWPVGWLLKAQLAIAPDVGGHGNKTRTMNNIKARLAPHFTHLLTDVWRSLPELTNADAAYCRDSNPAQSWSTGTVLEVLWELDRMERSMNESSATGM